MLLITIYDVCNELQNNSIGITVMLSFTLAHILNCYTLYSLNIHGNTYSSDEICYILKHLCCRLRVCFTLQHHITWQHFCVGLHSFSMAEAFIIMGKNGWNYDDIGKILELNIKLRFTDFKMGSNSCKK